MAAVPRLDPVVGAQGRRALRRVGCLFGVHDVLLAGYFVVLAVLVAASGSGASQAASARRIFGCLAVLGIACFVARAPSGLSVRARSVAYRLAIVAVVAESYLVLQALLPVVRPDAVDGALRALDRRLFGVDPALLLEVYATPAVVEYFAFFYFSYFLLCLGYAAVVLGATKLGPWTSEFAIGSVLVCCVGQLGYVMVPAFGPVVTMSEEFRAPLEGGFWWGCVRSAVEAGSARKDVFPSLHTAVPVWFTLFAARMGKRSVGWKIAAVVTGVFAAHIVVSTLLLRWHYGVDVIAGLVLAVGAGVVAPRLARWEGRARERIGAGGAWSFESAGAQPRRSIDGEAPAPGR